MGILKSPASAWASAAASVILHGIGFAALAGFAFSPAGAPPLAHGKGGSSIDVSIRWEGPRRAPEPVPVPPPAPPQEAAIPPPAAPPVPEAQPEAPVDLRTPASELPALPAAAPPAAPATAPATAPANLAPVELASVTPVEPPAAASVPLPPSPPPPPAVEPLEAPGAPGAEGPAVKDANALRPVYPLACRQASHEGTAVVRVVIGEDGKPLRVEIVRSAGCRELDQSALDAARAARFRPARRWGKPVISAIEQPFRFVLKG